MSERKGLLTVITPEIGEIVRDELNSQDDFLDKILSCMEKENSQVHCFLIGYAEWKQEVLSSGTFVYRCIGVADAVPKVTPWTYHEIVEQVKNSNFPKYVNRLCNSLKENNPWIFSYIDNFSSRFPKDKHEILNAGVTIYRFLEKQVENDLLKNPVIPFNVQEYPETCKLRKRLNIALFTENYEIASKLRDKINLTLEPLSYIPEEHLV